MKEPGKAEILRAVRQLAMLVRLGYPLAEGLKTMAAETSPWLTQVAQDMERGDSLAGALGRQPRLFSPTFRGLIEAAAANPQPDQVLQNLSHWLERSESIERKVGTLLLYPMLLLSLLALFAALFVNFVLPSTVLPLLSGLQSSQADLLLPVLPWLSLIPLGLLLLVGLSLLQGRPWEPLLWFFPEIRNLRGLASQALWARALGSLLAAGVPVLEALELALPVVHDADMQNQLRRASAAVRKGTPLAAALGSNTQLESYLVWSLEGEEVAAQVLDGADALEHEIELRSEQQLRLMGPRALILVGILCALVMLAFWWPFYDLTCSLS
jgi:type II secretory pathway component PulF